MAEGSLSILVDIEISQTVNELFDISEDLSLMIDLVPEYSRQEAVTAKDRIIDKLLDWVDAESKD